MKQLVIARKHHAFGRWAKVQHKIDLLMSNPLATRVISTDFGATLNLEALELENCSVANHCVVNIFIVHYDWRRVRYKNVIVSEDGSRS